MLNAQFVVESHQKFNEARPRASKRINYILFGIMCSQTYGTKGSGKYFSYLCYDDELEDLAGNFGRQPN